MDGAFCNYTEDDKMDYLCSLREAGVKNIEMEATVFAALTHEVGIKAAIVCVALLNRINGDQVKNKLIINKHTDRRRGNKHHSSGV